MFKKLKMEREKKKNLWYSKIKKKISFFFFKKFLMLYFTIPYYR